MKTLIQRFNEKYTKNAVSGCWEWIASTNQKYGHISVSNVGGTKKMRNAHRVSWELYNGPIPEGLQVLHKCDNRLCVNPDHLFLGTHQDNMNDMKQKNRQATVIYRPYGESNGNCKLTDAQVVEILSRIGETSNTKLSKEYGVNRRCIDRIMRGERRHQHGKK